MLQLYLNIATLLFFLPFNVFRDDACALGPNRRPLTCGIMQLLAGVGVGNVLPTPAPTPTPDKTVHSDRLQLQSWLRLHSPAMGRGRTGWNAVGRGGPRWDEIGPWRDEMDPMGAVVSDGTRCVMVEPVGHGKGARRALRPTAANRGVGQLHRYSSTGMTREVAVRLEKT